LTLARTILRSIGNLGLPCATEFLDTVVPHYLSDMVSWAAIGARTTESQVHRQMASGLSMPVGFKNGTDGSLQNAINAVRSARHPHAFLGIDAGGMSSVVRTTGNIDAHVVLRGGSSGTNYHAADVASAASALSKEGLVRGVMVDCSHDNSGKNHTKQAAVLSDVVSTFASGQKAILGVMVESNLMEGRQDWIQGVPLRHGVSITDACIGWSETEEVLMKAAASVARAQAEHDATEASAAKTRGQAAEA
jgi:3-deoxy-7-phosphoheptulonate synthase